MTCCRRLCMLNIYALCAVVFVSVWNTYIYYIYPLYKSICSRCFACSLVTFQRWSGTVKQFFLLLFICEYIKLLMCICFIRAHWVREIFAKHVTEVIKKNKNRPNWKSTEWEKNVSSSNVKLKEKVSCSSFNVDVNRLKSFHIEIHDFYWPFTT